MEDYFEFDPYVYDSMEMLTDEYAGIYAGVGPGDSGCYDECPDYDVGDVGDVEDPEFCDDRPEYDDPMVYGEP